MAAHPTFVHAAADLHRHDLLAEVLTDQRVRPIQVRSKSTGPGKAFRRAIICLAGALSRIIDDFEPGPGPSRTATTKSWMRS
jgi:hypothetical protein